ncbi:hypothetical protein PTKIN_Ptkin16aG0022600 [Pterospermum kingtungense]
MWLFYVWVKVKFLVVLVVNKKFDFLCIQESKIKVDSPRLHRWLWGNAAISCEVVQSDGNAGGLISCWRDDFLQVESKYVSDRYILVVGSIKKFNFRCGIGNIYAPNDDLDRRSFWEELVSVIRGVKVPWCLARDFNVVRNQEEK